MGEAGPRLALAAVFFVALAPPIRARSLPYTSRRHRDAVTLQLNLDLLHHALHNSAERLLEEMFREKPIAV